MMRIHGSMVRRLTVSALFLFCVPALADEVKKETTVKETKVRTSDTPADSADRAADNTGKNREHRPTADQQKNNRSDLETTRQIRRALVTDKSLSVYAHNVKIIAQNGTITLKGPVRTEDEKRIVEKKAAEVAGEANIRSEIEIAPKK